jgi:hypothetical protein
MKYRSVPSYPRDDGPLSPQELSFVKHVAALQKPKGKSLYRRSLLPK